MAPVSCAVAMELELELELEAVFVSWVIGVYPYWALANDLGVRTFLSFIVSLNYKCANVVILSFFNSIQLSS